MLRTFLLCFFIPFGVEAYSPKHIKLTQNEFQRLVKPQLNNIKQDYQTLIGILNPHLKDYKSIFRHFNDLKKREEKFINYCSKTSNENCQEIVNIYLNRLDQIIKTLYKVSPPKEDQHHPYEQTLKSFDLQQKLISELLDTHMQFFQMNFFHKAKIKVEQLPVHYTKLIQKANNQFNLFMIKSSDIRFQDQFLSYWNGFIKPISNYVLSQSEKGHFSKNLSDYNLRWNMLNVELTKRNKKISKQSKTLLKIMHNRWNNILKISLR